VPMTISVIGPVGAKLQCHDIWSAVFVL
jgi:hypothetical protein